MAAPSGTVTFLFTDIEGSTRRWDEQPTAMDDALFRHDAILRNLIERAGGYVVKAVGDAFHAAFTTAPAALRASNMTPPTPRAARSPVTPRSRLRWRRLLHPERPRLEVDRDSVTQETVGGRPGIQRRRAAAAMLLLADKSLTAA